VVRDFGREIEHAERELSELRPQMADAVVAWLDVTAPWVAAFWENSVDAAVADNPDAVKALGDEGRKSVKAEATKFIENGRAFIGRRLVDERHDAWPHLKPQTDPRDEAFRPNGKGSIFSGRISQSGGTRRTFVPSLVDIALLRVLGEIASIFSPHGFTLNGFDRSQGYGAGAWSVGRWPKPEWTDEMVEKINIYGDLHEKYVETLSRIQSVTAEKEMTEATELWGDA
jgi:hypothetical protein